MLNALATNLPGLIGGSADLAPSNMTLMKVRVGWAGLECFGGLGMPGCLAALFEARSSKQTLPQAQLLRACHAPPPASPPPATQPSPADVR